MQLGKASGVAAVQSPHLSRIVHTWIIEERTPVNDDIYTISASAYDLFNAPFRQSQLAAIAWLMPHIHPGHGPVLDIGAGTGLNIETMLEALPTVQVCALEPSRAMRSLAMMRIAAHPEWFARVTLRPESFQSAQLPETIGGAIALGVIGHLDPDERAHLLTELAARLPHHGAALIDLQEPETPRRVMPFDFMTTRIGDLTYQCSAEGWPVDDELMHWQMTYRCLEGSRVLLAESAEYDYRHPAAGTMGAEAAAAGLTMKRLDNSTYWLLMRR